MPTNPDLIAGYIPRRLSHTDGEGHRRQILELELDPRTAPIVILGEPGTGKTELLKSLSGRHLVPFITASALLRRSRPEAELGDAAYIVLDALDEAAARREGDAVDRILEKLDVMGRPRFVLSCRAADWEARTNTSIEEDYGVAPVIYSIEPMNREEARRVLASVDGRIDVEDVLDELDRQQLGDLAGNPFMLTLLGQVVVATGIPRSRAQLFERAASLMWSEHNQRHTGSALNALSEVQALDGIGAAFAALLLSGNEALTRAGAGNTLDGQLRIAEVVALPGAATADAMLGSKLVKSDGAGGFLPLHRVMAEFLGARWLARRASTRRTTRRLLSVLGSKHAIPVRLRGLHAWLAYHGGDLAARVITRDPYGVLRYGDCEGLNSVGAGHMLDALEELARLDPWFRSGDWDSHPIAALMRPDLAERLDRLAGSTSSNPHLRSLLIEGAAGAEIVPRLPSLHLVAFDPKRFQRERVAAMKAIAPLEGFEWRKDAVERLLDLADEESAEVALCLLTLCGDEFAPETIIRVILAVSGLLACPVPKPERGRIHTIRSYDTVLESLDNERLKRVLDSAADCAELFGRNVDWEQRGDITDFVAGAILKVLEGGLTESEVARLWRWLSIIEEADIYRREKRQHIQELLANGPLRRAIHSHAILERPPRKKGSALYGLWRLGLNPTREDVAALLAQLATKPNHDRHYRAQWRELVGMARTDGGLDSQFVELAEGFARNDQELLEEIAAACSPRPTPDWEIEEQKSRGEAQAKRNELKLERIDKLRRHLAGLVAGDVARATWPARAFLGHLADCDAETPRQRLGEWVGEDLVSAALKGFQAAMRRSDLPDLQTAAESAAKGTIWNIVFPLAAGLLDRLDAGGDIRKAPEYVAQLVLLYSGEVDRGSESSDGRRLLNALRAEFLTDAKCYETYLRLRIEPKLESGAQHVSGIYEMTHEPKHRSVAVLLCGEWLDRFTDMQLAVEHELVGGLLAFGEWQRLKSIAAGRHAGVFRDLDSALFWSALDWLLDFETASTELVGIGEEYPQFLFNVHARLDDQRRGTLFHLTAPQREWLVREFRGQWPSVDRFTGDGDRNDSGEAAEVIRRLIDGLASDTSVHATEALARLASSAEDSWTSALLHAAAEQRQKAAETAFEPIAPRALADLLDDGPPADIEDLRALVIEELQELQERLWGSDTDTASMFWQSPSKPWDENRCRDRLADLLSPHLERYGIQRIPERDMPAGKRADLAFAIGDLQLPLEAKGQWHDKVWKAASGQLDLQYLRDWRSRDRGIYLVFWFGNLPSASGKRLRAPPAGIARPATSDEMKASLIALVPQHRRSAIDVVVLDLAGIKT